jgi:REP element-mobilizing transposase RayT
MPRRPREIEPGAIVHVVSRGVDRQPIFIDDDDRQRFLALVVVAGREDRLRCLNFCLMGNHFHLVAKALEEPFGAVMRDVLSAHVRWFNERHGRKGHLVEQRYWSNCVKSERYMCALARYVAFNPVAAGFCSRPSGWPWSGHRELAGRIAPTVTNVEDALLHFGASVEQGRTAYRALIDGVSERSLALDRIACSLESETRRSAIYAARALGCTPHELAAAVPCHVDSIYRLLARRTDKGV